MKREEIIDTIFANMQSMHRSSTTKFHALLGQEDVSYSQLELLLVIKQSQPISPKEIAAQLHLTPGAVTQLIEGLVQKNYVTRETDATDRRVLNISLSADGTQKLQTIWEQRKIVIRKIMQSLETDELAVMLKVQQKISQHLQEEIAKATERKMK